MCFLLYWRIDLRFGSLGGLSPDHIILGVSAAKGKRRELCIFDS